LTDHTITSFISLDKALVLISFIITEKEKKRRENSHKSPKMKRKDYEIGLQEFEAQFKKCTPEREHLN